MRRMAQELAGQVREWLDRAGERVMDRLGSGQSEMALAGGRDDREEELDLATRLRDAWEAQQGREKGQEDDAPEREAPQDFAARLRQAATGIDRDAFADRAAALRDGREADERHTAQEVAREQERVKELERAQEREIQRGRRRGIGMSM